MSKKLTNYEFNQKLQKTNPNIYIISEYINTKIYVTCKCKICSYEWQTQPDKLIHGVRPTGCPKCKNRVKLTIDDVKQRILNSNIIIIGEYITTNTTTSFKCKICSYEWKTKPCKIIDTINPTGCPKCKNRVKLTIDDVTSRIEHINKNIIILSKNVTSINDKIEIQCKICNNIWKSTPKNLFKGKGCPKCNESHGERLISIFLDDNNIKYSKNHRFENCKKKRALPFDFFIEKLNLCIEFDGKQHFSPVQFKGISKKQADENFKKQKEHDDIKTTFCNNNNIKLLRISYLEIKQIENILKNHIL